MHSTEDRKTDMQTNTDMHALNVVGELKTEQQKQIISQDALDFLNALVTKFSEPLQQALDLRHQRQAKFDAGELPNFRADTQAIRDDKSWKVAPIPTILQDRRVEITGPVDRKMVINALNSGEKSSCVALKMHHHRPGKT